MEAAEGAVEEGGEVEVEGAVEDGTGMMSRADHRDPRMKRPEVWV
jgi:hypothetical protein